LPDKVEGENVGAQPKALNNIAAKSRTQIAGTGRYDNRIDFFVCERGSLQCRTTGGSREPRRMCGKTPVQSVSINDEYFFKRIDSQPTSVDAVFPAEHSICNGM
jgi:hypothetical protein